jgi:hypothetical protein
VERITASFSGVPTVTVLNYLEEKGGVQFFYKEEWFAGDSVTVRFANHKVSEAVDLMFSRKPYTYRVLNGDRFVLLPRAQVAMLAGQMPNYSNNGSDEEFSIVGNVAEIGKHKTASVTGKVTDGKSGEPVIGATIQIQNLQQGVVTNTQGDYKLLIAPGLYTLIVSSVGYETSQFNIKVISNGEFKMELFDKSVRFDDIVIYGQRLDKNVSSHQMSMVELNIHEIGQLPSVAGGRDILKGLTIMPGVKSIGEFSSGINVRGGGEDQNLYLVNSAPLFYTAHVFGLVSVINPDAVDKLTLYKGHIPASYGERVSSVIDIKTADTAPKKFTAKGGVGIYDSRLMFSVPVVKDKVFFDIGARASYSGWLLDMMKDYDLKNSKAGFYDVNSSLHLNLGKSHLSVSGYYGSDEFRFSSYVKYQYQNKLASLNWKYLHNSNLASYVTLAYSNYNVDKDAINTATKKSRLNSQIQYSSFKYRIQYGGFQKHNIEAGISCNRYDIAPGKVAPLDTVSLVHSASIDKEQGYEGAVFVNDEFSLSNRILINIGLRYSGYAAMGPGHVAQYLPNMPIDTVNIDGYADYGKKDIIKFYSGLEPRISMRIKLNDESSLKMSYNRNVQYLSLISYSSVSTPSDIWKLAGAYIRPLIADQFAVGFYRNLLNNTIEGSIEVYYKGLRNVIDYMDGASLEMNNHIETELTGANGRNYGFEIMIRKNTGQVDGWISYTYSRSLRKTFSSYSDKKINNNEYYPSSYDRPHDFSMIANFHLNKRIIFSGNFSYSTGRPITLPESFYDLGNDQVALYSEKNKYRIPPYHRLDLTMTMNESLRLHKKWKGYWSFSILNVYGRKNPYTIYYKQEVPNASNNYERFNLYKLYLIGRPVPTLTYTFIF